MNYKYVPKLKKIDVDTALEVNGESAIIITFNMKRKKKTEEPQKMGIIITIAETKKKNFMGRNKCTLMMEEMNVSFFVWRIILYA